MKQKEWDDLHTKAYAQIRRGEISVEEYLWFTFNMAHDRPSEALQILDRAKAVPHL